MTERVHPPPDKYASCPYDERILEYYKEQFDCVYIILSPFARPHSVPLERFSPDSWPSKLEFIEGAEPISWQDVLDRTPLSTIAEIDIGLRSSIGGLSDKYGKKELANELDKLRQTEKIIYPSEGDISPFIENRLYDALQKIGHQWLWLGDEFCSERKLFWIEDLKQVEEIPSHGCVFTPDKSVLITTHWDSHFSLLCSSKETIDNILDKENFEGFFCSPQTEIYWSIPTYYEKS